MRSAAVRRWLASGLIAAASAAAPPAFAADNVPGKWHEDKVVGFRFRPLNEWQAIPSGTDPEDPRVVGFYSDKKKFNSSLARPESSVFAFKVQREGTATPSGDAPGPVKPDEKPSQEEMIRRAIAESRIKSTRQAFDNLRTRLLRISEQGLATLDEKKRKKVLKEIDAKDPVENDIKQDGAEIKVIECSVPLAFPGAREVIGIKLAAGWIVNEEYEVGVVYQVPLDEWRKYGKGVYSSLASLEFLDGAEVAAARQDLADALAGKTGDERWLEEIKRKVTPGWDHLQTRNYLVIFDKSIEKEFITKVARQIEAIRKDIYEGVFPSDRPVTAISVVRVCKDPSQYHQYGGPGGSAGYWNWVDQELVFYDDGSKDSLRVLNHEAFHQYIFYSVGNVSPHSWFNEGHGDYFAGHEFGKDGKFVAKKFQWRFSTIKGSLGSKSYVPLKIFVRYSQKQYYANGGPNYAQGWGLVWFLRETKDPEWKGLLETYFDTLKSEVTKWVKEQEEVAKKDGTWKEGWKPGKTPPNIEEEARDKAIEATFGSWDDRKWEKFEKEWKDFL